MNIECHGTNAIVRIGELTCLIHKEKTGCVLYYRDKRGGWMPTDTVRPNIQDFFNYESKENTMKIDNIKFQSNATIIDGIGYSTTGWFERAGLTQKLKEYVQNLKLTYSREVDELVHQGIRTYKLAHPTNIYALVGNLNCKYVLAYIAKGQSNRIAMIPKNKYLIHLMERVTTWLSLRSDDFTLNYVQRMQEVEKFEDWLKEVTFNIRMMPSEEWLRTHGVLLKTGKFLRMCVPNIREDEVQILAQHVQKCLDINAGLCAHMVKVSDKPSDIYVIPGFTVCESCMSDKGEEFFKLYDDIENCSIAYIIDDSGELKARALLWNTVEGHKIMDRIYAKNGNLETTMMVWAKAHGYLYKTQQAQGWHHYSNGDETITLYKLSVDAGFNFTEEMYEHVPYMDTFAHIVKDDHCLYSQAKEVDRTVRKATLKSTNGYAAWLTIGTNCVRCGDPIDPDELRYHEDDPYCELCYGDSFAYCENCDRDYPVEEITWGIFDEHEMYLCEDCIQNYVQSERNPDQWCRKCDAITIHLQNGREMTVHPEDAIEDYCTWECINCNQVWDDPDWDPNEDGEDYYCPNCRD